MEDIIVTLESIVADTCGKVDDEGGCWETDQ